LSHRTSFAATVPKFIDRQRVKMKVDDNEAQGKSKLGLLNKLKFNGVFQADKPKVCGFRICDIIISSLFAIA
jgi:hypothetical protein